MTQNSEASVEEILESIKKVIARDNREVARETRRQRESDGIISAHEKSPASEDADEGADESAAEEAESSEDILELSDLEMTAPELADEDDRDEAEEVPLTSDNMRDAVRENFAALAMLAEPGAPPQIVRSGETSLEGLVRDLLRPMLAGWLDQNLPEMVEKMVQAEIARIAHKRD